MAVTLPSGGAGFVRAVSCAALGAGSKAFMEHYGVKYPLYTGAMAKGIASAELVIASFFPPDSSQFQTNLSVHVWLRALESVLKYKCSDLIGRDGGRTELLLEWMDNLWQSSSREKAAACVTTSPLARLTLMF